MKKILTLLVPCFIFGSGAWADLYLRGGLFYANSSDVSVDSTESFQASIDDGVGFNVAVGYQLTYFRLEGEFNTLSSDIGGSGIDAITNSGSLDRDSVFANFIFEIPTTPFIEPYFGAGVGISQVSLDMQTGFEVGGESFNFSGSVDDTVLSYQLMAGVRFSLRDSFSIYVAYRYLSINSLDLAEANYRVGADKGSSLFEIGVGFGF